MRYAVKITDPSTERRCKVYVSTDEDLGVLLLFLKSANGLEYEVRDLKEESPDT